MEKLSLYLLLLFISCSKKDKIEILNIAKPNKYVYLIDKEKQYTSYTIQINGFVDDTIIINNKYYLAGKIDTIIRNDYYGGDKEIELNYNPYKGKKGKLNIIHYAN